MIKWLLPQGENFYLFFEKHMKLTLEASLELLALLSTGANIQKNVRRIKELETEADLVTDQCTAALHRTFITPFQRDDIYRLINKMDDIIDYIEEIAGHILVYGLTQMTHEIHELATIFVSLIKKISGQLNTLSDLKNIDVLKKSFAEIIFLDDRADDIHLRAVGKLFESFQDPCMIIKWKEIYNYLKKAIGRCKEVSNIIEGVILEST
jgi:hypothetical protein